MGATEHYLRSPARFHLQPSALQRHALRLSCAVFLPRHRQADDIEVDITAKTSQEAARKLQPYLDAISS